MQIVTKRHIRCSGLFQSWVWTEPVGTLSHNPSIENTTSIYIREKKYFPIVTHEADKLLFRSLAGNTSSSIALTTTTHHRRNYENAIRQLRYRNQGKKNCLGN